LARRAARRLSGADCRIVPGFLSPRRPRWLTPGLPCQATPTVQTTAGESAHV